MVDMTGDKKKEACDTLAGFPIQVGAAGLIEIMKCAGDFPKAYKEAKAFCGTSKASGSVGLRLRSHKATIEVRVRACVRVCVCVRDFVMELSMSPCAICVHIYSFDRLLVHRIVHVYT